MTKIHFWFVWDHSKNLIGYLDHSVDVALGPRELGRVLHLDEDDEIEIVPHVVLRLAVLLE